MIGLIQWQDTTILMKTYFSGEESDFFDESMQSIKYLIDMDRSKLKY